ncbi:hypothetical protein E4T44_00976 [Aureobasidium sp. EXF-8845]|nr:hypothetical protein E4T44_00976 [Aureobasidium sp. EXF-8845]KAI4857517.1 hypothetical protein E4T45_00992 [Aureobasidium sp. EXF-8846]
MWDRGNHICGCYYTASYGQRTYLPQVQLDSHTTITPLYYTTNLSQTFSNPSGDQLSETRYTFPLYDGVAVTAFSCAIGEKVIKGHVEHKEQARKTFDDAVSRGETAGLLESLPTGVFGVTLGNIPANTSIQVDITYGAELKHDAQIDGLRYILPTSIARRYGSYPGGLLQLDSAVVKGMKVTVDINMEGSAIRKVQCPSAHPIAVDIGVMSTILGSIPDMSKASASLVLPTTELLTDVVLQILIDDVGSPKAILENHSLPGRQALMTTFVPQFKLKPIRPEIIFIADQSGSMQGTKNTALVAALKTFLKSLPPGVRFNICAFGSSHNFLWEKSVPYNQDNFNQALRFVQGFTASYGGTELLSPVKAAFESHLPDMPLELVVLTDGQIYAESQLFSYLNGQIHEKKVDARCFVLGVGRDVSHTLVEGFARAGNGISQFITDDEIMDFKVVRMLKASLYPHIKDYRLEIKYDDADDFEMVESVVPKQAVNTPVSTVQPKAPISLFDPSANLSDISEEHADRYAHLPHIAVPEVIQAPHVIPPLLPYNRTTMYLLLQDMEKTPKSIVLHGTSPDGPLTLEIPIKMIDNPSYTVNTLAAKRVIQELEEGRGWLNSALEGSELIKNKHSSRFDELVEKEVVRLGVDYQVANKWCSFVAVQPNQNEESTTRARARAQEDFDSASVSPPEHRKMKRGRPAHALKQQQQFVPSQMQQSMAQMQQQQAMAPPTSGFMSVPDVAFARVASYGAAPLAYAPAAPLAYAPAAPPPPPRPAACSVSIPFPPCAPASPAAPCRRRALPAFVALSAGAPSGSSLDILMAPDAASPEVVTPPIIPANDTLAAVRAFVDLQSFDGHWEWNEVLAAFFISEAVEMKNARALPEDSMLATVLVLAWLNTVAVEYFDLWEMVADKGDSWLLTQVHSEQLMKTAMSAIKNRV